MRINGLKNRTVLQILRSPSLATMLTSVAEGFKTRIFMSEIGYSVIDAWRMHGQVH